MNKEYQDSIREGFEVYIAKQLRLEAVPKDVLAVQVFAMNDNREYKDKKLQLKWGEWGTACRLQIDKDADICAGLSGIPTRPGTFAFTDEEMNKRDSCLECREAILSQGAT